MMQFPLPLLANQHGTAFTKPRACDRALNYAEECAVNCGLHEIRLNEDFVGTQFWGKVRAVRSDYLIIDAVAKPERGAHHKYFFSQDGGLTWAQLPAVEPWMSPICDTIANERFSGIAEHIWSELPAAELEKMTKSEATLDKTHFMSDAALVGDDDEEGSDAENEDGDDDEGSDAEAEDEDEKSGDEDEENDDASDAAAAKKADDSLRAHAAIVEEMNEEEFAPPKWFEQRLTELHRLAWTVQKVSDECHIAPIGSLILTSSKRLKWNRAFAGLTIAQASDLQRYRHFRRPRSEAALNAYLKATASNDDDFLDIVTDDLPRNTWRMKSKSCGMKITVQNLLWPGFEFNYDCLSHNFAQYYFGEGTRRSDVVFML